MSDRAIVSWPCQPRAVRAGARLIPGGVNSPVRAFRGVGGSPLFIASASGCRVEDEDGRSYLDYIGSWGPMILGHGHPAVVEARSDADPNGVRHSGLRPGSKWRWPRRSSRRVPSLERVRMVNSGTEATMAAVRLARGATGRSKIVKFEGCYHGHGDSFLIKAGSGAATFGVPDSAGVTEGTARDTLTAAFNDLDGVSRLFRRAPAGDRRRDRRTRRRQHGRRASAAGIPAGPARSLHARGRRADPGRGDDRLSAGPGRRAGALRRARRSDHARQGHRRRAAGRRVRRASGPHGASRAGRAGVSGGHAVGQSAGDGGRSRDAASDRRDDRVLRDARAPGRPARGRPGRASRTRRLSVPARATSVRCGRSSSPRTR